MTILISIKQMIIIGYGCVSWKYSIYTMILHDYIISVKNIDKATEGWKNQSQKFLDIRLIASLTLKKQKLTTACHCHAIPKGMSVHSHTHSTLYIRVWLAAGGSRGAASPHGMESTIAIYACWSLPECQSSNVVSHGLLVSLLSSQAGNEYESIRDERVYWG
jgi:hypothetical protein